MTLNGVQGVCRPIKTCSNVQKLFKGKSAQEIRAVFENSQCITGKSWLCCPDQRTPRPAKTPPPFVKGKLPKSPECGIDLADRIVGGEETRIDEFPWVAQILYNAKFEHRESFSKKLL